MKYHEWELKRDQSEGGKILCQIARLSEDYYFLKLDKEDLLKKLEKFRGDMKNMAMSYDSDGHKMKILNIRHCPNLDALI